jgi:hypothetical protein
MRLFGVACAQVRLRIAQRVHFVAQRGDLREGGSFSCPADSAAFTASIAFSISGSSWFGCSVTAGVRR